jgi:hypothetical protein
MVGRKTNLHWQSEGGTKSPKLEELGGQKTRRREAKTFLPRQTSL